MTNHSIAAASTVGTEDGQAAPPARQQRLMSLDAYRGFIMLFLASGGLGLAQVAKQHPDSFLWQWLAHHTSHVPWLGGGAWDMIQPSFMFMVGMAVPFSLANRGMRAIAGQTFGQRLLPAVWRAAVLVALGVFLASNGKQQPEFVFVNVLAQIGLGYVFLVALAGQGQLRQMAAIAAITVTTWAAFALFPLPELGVDLTGVGITAKLAPDVSLPGFFGHWSMNTNVFAAFDSWFLNLFPRESPFVFNTGGYQTLNFVPSLITMILGLMAGEVLRDDGGPLGASLKTPLGKLRWLLGAGGVCVVLGVVAGATVCPLVKRIWTPSWAIFSGGVSLWMVAAFYWAIDVRGWRSWAWPLVVVGMNSIAIYLAYQLLAGWIKATAKCWISAEMFVGTYDIVWHNMIVVAVLWLWCWWLYRRQIFLRI